MSDTSDDISDKSLRDRVHFEVPVLADQLYRSPDRQALRADTIDRLTQALAEANARADRERAAVVAWMRDDADQTERCAINLAPKSVKSQYQEWVDLVATKRGIANAIERGQHLAAKRAAALSDLAALDGESL